MEKVSLRIIYKFIVKSHTKAVGGDHEASNVRSPGVHLIQRQFSIAESIQHLYGTARKWESRTHNTFIINRNSQMNEKSQEEEERKGKKK